MCLDAAVTYRGIYHIGIKMQWKIISAVCGCFVNCVCVCVHVCVCVRVRVHVCDSGRGARSCPGHSCMDAIRGEWVTTATVQPRHVRPWGLRGIHGKP